MTGELFARSHENLSAGPNDLTGHEEIGHDAIQRNDPHNKILTLKEQAKTLWATGDKDGAIQANTEALDHATHLDDRPEIAGILSTIGKMQIVMGNSFAASNLQRSTDLYRELGDKHRLAASLGLLGRALLRANDIDGGEQAINESMNIALQLKDHWQIAYGLALMAEVAVARKDYHRAALLWSASEANYDSYDTMLDHYDRRAADLRQDRVRRILGELIRADVGKRYAIAAAGSYGVIIKR